MEDENLRNKILSYYQQTIPQISLIEISYEKLTSKHLDLLMSEKEHEDINTTLLNKRTKIILSGINNFTKYNQKSYEDTIKDAESTIKKMMQTKSKNGTQHWVLCKLGRRSNNEHL